MIEGKAGTVIRFAIDAHAAKQLKDHMERMEAEIMGAFKVPESLWKTVGDSRAQEVYQCEGNYASSVRLMRDWGPIITRKHFDDGIKKQRRTEMKCETRFDGRDCGNEAKYRVWSNIIRSHVCCESCKDMWVSYNPGIGVEEIPESGLKAWKREFYCEEAATVGERKDEFECLDHSIKKWEGLRISLLVKHELTKQDTAIVDGHDHQLQINEASCTLCKMVASDCSECPIQRLMGHTCQESACRDSDNGAYQCWMNTGNPEPMIDLLKETKKRLVKEKWNTWKEGFYPISAKDFAETHTMEECLDHSIRKWEGMQADVLKKHGLILQTGVFNGSKYLASQNDDELSVMSETCALCWKTHFDECLPNDKYSPQSACSKCPLSEDPCGRGIENPWAEFVRSNNAAPMLEQLKAAKRKMAEESKKNQIKEEAEQREKEQIEKRSHNRPQLVKSHSGWTLKMVDQNGEHIYSGNLLDIDKKTGRISLRPGINKEFGFDLDVEGRLKVR